VYDANGNITSITESGLAIQYEYNELNEVIRENNQRDNKTFVYNYDLGGNLLSKVEYVYTTGTLGTPVVTIPYVYGNTNWKDLLTSFNGKAITYDAIGNPLTYDGGTFAWEGRKLTSFNKTGLAVSYTYNESGIRTSKTVNGTTTNYRLSGDKVTFEQTGSDSIYYVYDTQGQLISMILNGTEYGYIRNAQNDIVGLINSAGTQVVAYTYSTWGEVLSITGTLATTLGAKNPYRYRGYRYDSETGLYYLQSRYYNPQWGRFLNADSITSTSINVLGQNMFIYCNNNPVKSIDPSGKFSINLDDIQKGLEGTAQFIAKIAGAIWGGMVNVAVSVGGLGTYLWNTMNRANNIVHDKKVHAKNVMEIGSGRTNSPVPFRNTRLGNDPKYVEHCKAVYQVLIDTQQMVMMPEQDLSKLTWDQLSKSNQNTIYSNMRYWDQEVFNKFFNTYGKDQVIDGINAILN
jgi:RHS repeat-associated protein